MIRIFFLYILPLLLPSIVYALWTRLVLKKESRVKKKPAPIVLLLTIGLFFMGVFLGVFATSDSYSEGETYVRARYENGKIVPAHTEDAESKK